MKKSLALFALLAGPIFAQSTVQPFGIWNLCESPQGAGSAYCADFQPGHELYSLHLQTSNAATVAYQYSVRGHLVNGQAVEVHGTIGRVNAGGFIGAPPTDRYITTALLDFGGIVAGSLEITVTELVATAVTQSRQAQ